MKKIPYKIKCTDVRHWMVDGPSPCDWVFQHPLEAEAVETALNLAFLSGITQTLDAMSPRPKPVKRKKKKQTIIYGRRKSNS